MYARAWCTSVIVAASACGGSAAAVGAVDAGTSDGASVVEARDAATFDANDSTQPVAPLHVLFIGNSYTAVNDLPKVVHDIAASSGVPPLIEVESIAPGGALFIDHWTGPDARPRIAAGGHTHVVLQAQSVEPILGSDSFMQYGGLLGGAAASASAAPVLFQTWARKGDAFYAQESWAGGSPDAMQDKLIAAYDALAKKSTASVAPVGAAWRTAWNTHPEITIHAADGSHPTIAGTYLAACVFYISLTGRPLPETSAVPAGVTPNEAATLRAIAMDTTSAK